MKGFTKTGLAIAVALILLVAVLLGTSAYATFTPQDQCNETFTYTKSQDFNDSRVEIDFENSDQQIDVSAKSGYIVTEVALEVPDDGFSGFHVYANGPVSNFNPPGNQDINVAKVTVKKSCPTPTVTPTVSPTATPTVTPTGTVTPTPTDTVRPTPTPTQEPTSGGTPPTFAGSSTEAPQCSETAPTKTMANFHVYRKGDQAIVKWFPTEGNKAHIYYKEVSSPVWQHAIRDTANDGYEEIGGLGTQDITFAGQQANGCAGGPLTQEVVDGNETTWVLFR